MSDTKQPAGYSIEVYQREDGWWSFRVNGAESRYRSSSPEGLQRTVNALLQGPKPGAVRLKAVKADAKALPGLEEGKRAALAAQGLTPEQIDAAAGVLLAPDPLPADHWSLKATVGERVAAFLAR